jgi:outer membrane protein
MQIRNARMAFILFAFPGLVVAQGAQSVPTRLSLTEALTLARQNSPVYQQVLNDADPAAAQVKAAYGAFLPSLNSSLGASYSRAGSQRFANQIFSQGSSTISSNYNISASWGLSYAKILAPKQSKLNQRAIEENITAQGSNLTLDIVNQYLAVLRAAANVEVARQQVTRNEEFRAQADARFQVGRGNMVDVRQAEVAKANSDLTLLRALESETGAKIELVRRIGLPIGAEVDQLELTENFALVEPDFEVMALQQIARSANPDLRAADAREQAAMVGVSSARSQYLPSFTVSTGISGFTQQFTNSDPSVFGALASAQGQASNCQFQNDILSRLTSPHPSPNGGIIDDCNAFSGLDATGTNLMPEVEQGIRDSNTGWPFGFTRQPWSISFGISVPLFDGFSRAANVSAARAQADDARESLRSERLRIDASVRLDVLGVNTSWQAANIADLNRGLAAEQLSLAQQRYQVGNGTALEVADAQNAVTRAEATYVQSVYDYHTAVASLERTVGRPIR